VERSRSRWVITATPSLSSRLLLVVSGGLLILLAALLAMGLLLGLSDQTASRDQ
jgi:hypothetical protein